MCEYCEYISIQNDFVKPTSNFSTETFSLSWKWAVHQLHQFQQRQQQQQQQQQSPPTSDSSKRNAWRTWTDSGLRRDFDDVTKKFGSCNPCAPTSTSYYIRFPFLSHFYCFLSQVVIWLSFRSELTHILWKIGPINATCMLPTFRLIILRNKIFIFLF